MICEHRREPAICVDCAALAERARVLTLFDEVFVEGVCGTIGRLRRAIAEGGGSLPDDEEDDDAG